MATSSNCRNYPRKWALRQRLKRRQRRRQRRRHTLNNAVGAQFVRCNKIKLKFETTTTTDRQKEARLLSFTCFPLFPSLSVSLFLFECTCVCVSACARECVCLSLCTAELIRKHRHSSSSFQPPPTLTPLPTLHLLHFSAASPHFTGNYDKTVITFICCWQQPQCRCEKKLNNA